MSPTRRTTIAGAAAAGGLAAIPGAVYAKGEADDDQRDGKTGDEADGGDGRAGATPPESALRVAHLSPDAPNVDVYLAGECVLADVDYGTVSHYLEVDIGSYNARITAAGDPETVLVDDEITVTRGFNTLAALGEVDGDSFRATFVPDAGSALLRFVHASPDAPAVDVYAGETALFEDVEFGDVCTYRALPAADYELDIRPSDDAETSVATATASLELGAAYSAMAIGYLESPDGSEGRDFEIRCAVDGTMGPASDAESHDSTASDR